ncbi:bifunctional glycosyltransferase family 2/GtrA family protein [Pseudobacteroides cellulosolvens]|uniref:GtrA family protein n=1 Tax=Pseudobacteroides cellulosolvens ATCC 35603 = DSM 2933 TaxID=398512 RepID=A0A0L6JU23_9FIRM|nr:bifunctional glycosyltransferase family 2/GtrA family protein [Pseudobacteroides cellulosolvens]KNY29204.1 GtrA family protein [Pseudobacteroides cellulosolvens ATCC 35603 = DSM 2933]
MTILIPAYEPTEKLLSLVVKLKEKTDYKILIIDDGSGKHFQHIFKKTEYYGCTVLHHIKNRGKGESLRTGFAYQLLDSASEPLVCADSDGQHSIDDIIKIANTIDTEKNEMVLGIRQFDGKVPFKSRLGNNVSAFFFKLVTGIAITDTQTGLRGYPSRLLSWLGSVKGSRFEYELNLLLNAKEDGITIKQVPISTIYDDNNGTHFRPIKDSILVLMPLIRFCSSSLTSAFLDFILLFVFQGLTGNLFWSVVTARVISSVFNYLVNRFFVFRAKNVSNMQSASKYFGLVAVIMFLNYSLIALLINVLYVSDVLAKLLTEITLFILSYSVQKLFIFKKNNMSKPAYTPD